MTDVVRLRSSRLERHACPASSISYVGDCPILGCPANMVRLSQGRMSGCVFDAAGSRIELGILPNVLGLTQREVKHRYSNGFRNLSRMTELMNVLISLRESPNLRWSCPRCGVMKAVSGPCLNAIRCTERRKLMRHAVSCAPLNVVGLDITPAEFWMLLQRQLDDDAASKYVSASIEAAGRKLTERLA